MRATFAIMSLLPVLLLATPASAATKEDKMKTCEFGADNFGADNVKLAGKKRSDFIKKCMANANYEPAARKDAMKKTATKKKPAAKKPAAMAPAAAPAAAPAQPPAEQK